MKIFRHIGIVMATAALSGVLHAGPYDILFRVANPKGECQVKAPGAAAFVPAVRNKAYPYGTTVRTGGGDSSIVILISESDAVRILADTTVTLDKAPGVADGRLITLSGGTVLTRFSQAVTNTPVFIDSPVGRGMDMLGNCKLVLSRGASGSTLMARAESNSRLKFIAPQLIVPVLRNGYGVSITTTDDGSFTRVNNLLGDYRLFINTSQSLDPPLPADDEAGNEYLLPVRTSSKSAISIWREFAPVGNRLIVSVLATDSDGKGSQSFAFAVGDPSVTSRSQVRDVVATTNAPAAGEPDAAGEDAEAEGTGEDDPLAEFAEHGDEHGGDGEDGEPAPAADETDDLDEFLF